MLYTCRKFIACDKVVPCKSAFREFKALFRPDSAGTRALKWTLFTHSNARNYIIVHKQLGKGNVYREISGKFGVVNTTGTDENPFRLVRVLGHGARVLPLELVPVLGHGARVLPLELMPVPGTVPEYYLWS